MCDHRAVDFELNKDVTRELVKELVDLNVIRDKLDASSLRRYA